MPVPICIHPENPKLFKFRGKPQYDLDQWNPEFFERLHRFLSLAGDYGIIVEVVMLSNTYGDSVWELNPLHPRNNVNGLEDAKWPEYIHSLDIVRATPAPHIVQEQPEHTLPSVLAVDGEDYSLYLADCREQDEAGAGQPISGRVVCDLPHGDFEVASYSPVTGAYSAWSAVRGGENTPLAVPPFNHDTVLRVRKRV